MDAPVPIVRRGLAHDGGDAGAAGVGRAGADRDQDPRRDAGADGAGRPQEVLRDRAALPRERDEHRPRRRARPRLLPLPPGHGLARLVLAPHEAPLLPGQLPRHVGAPRAALRLHALHAPEPAALEAERPLPRPRPLVPPPGRQAALPVLRGALPHDDPRRPPRRADPRVAQPPRRGRRPVRPLRAEGRREHRRAAGAPEPLAADPHLHRGHPDPAQAARAHSPRRQPRG